ncbi:hypothetical protein VTO73DRAFT_6849 [Trametes versicolor]
MGLPFPTAGAVGVVSMTDTRLCLDIVAASPDPRWKVYSRVDGAATDASCSAPGTTGARSSGSSTLLKSPAIKCGFGTSGWSSTTATPSLCVGASSFWECITLMRFAKILCMSAQRSAVRFPKPFIFSVATLTAVFSAILVALLAPLPLLGPSCSRSASV